MFRIDGSVGEGGGQTVRTALSLAAVTRRDVEIFNIRKNRSHPGLGHELIATARAVAAVTHGRLENDAPGSDTIRYFAGAPQSGRFEFSIGDTTDGTGSAPLVLQTLAPVLSFANGTSEIVIKGGTHVPFSPTGTYLQTVFAPSARKLGFRGEIATASWGWAPHGMGELRARIEPVESFRSADLTQRGVMLQIGGSSVASGLDPGFADRQKDRVNRRMSEVGRTASLQVVNIPCESKGGMLYLLAVFERTIAGFTSIVYGNVLAEQVADDAVNELFAYITSYAVVDKHLADQLLIYAALADGQTNFSTAELTSHTQATAEIIEQMLPARVSFAGKVGEMAEVEVLGAGLTR